MSTPAVKGPFSGDKYRHAALPGLWRVSLNPEEHYAHELMCQRVRDGHFLMLGRNLLVHETTKEHPANLHVPKESD